MNKRISIVLLAALVLAVAVALTPVGGAAQAKAEEESGWSVMQLHSQGGAIMYFIDLCLILGVAVAGERFFNLRKSKIISTEFLEEIKRHWYRRDTAAAMEVCKDYDIAISRILRSGLLRFDHGLQDIENAIQGAGMHEATDLRKNMGWLATFASVAPMLGLFGTVIGMHHAFGKIAEADTVNPSIIALGIRLALVTTAWGLPVGIFNLMMHYFFRRRVETRVFEMEEVSLRLIEDLAYSTGPAAAEKRPMPPVAEEEPQAERPAAAAAGQELPRELILEE